VYWGSYDGPFLEKTRAILVAQDEPHTVRRTPASGDGGIDLMIPRAGGFIVEQVKGFTGRLNGNRKPQIEKSWAKLRKDPRLPSGKKHIAEYRLVVPIDPTPDEQEWFEKLVADADFPCYWHGESDWDSLASTHPHVIDYLFHGGRDRLLLRQQELLATVRDPFTPVTVLDVAASLEMTRAWLDKDDPHYRYEFSTTEAPLTLEQIDQLGPYAFAHSREIRGGGYLTVRVVPKHDYSLRDEPIGGKFEIKIDDPGRARVFREALEGFQKFGRALDIPDGSLFAEINAPGGLSTTIKGGGARIEPAFAPSRTTRLRLAIAGDQGERLAELPIATTSHTVGPLGGAELKLTDSSHTLDVTLRVAPPNDDEPRIAFSMTMRDLAGRAAREVGDAARLLGHLRAPNELQLLMEYGPKVLARHPIADDIEMLSLGAGLHITDLAFLQDHAPFEILVPDELNSEFAAELHQHVRMMRGEEITGAWDEVTVELKADADRTTMLALFQRGGMVATEITHEVVFEDHDPIEIGPFTTILATARLADEQDPAAGAWRLVPGSSNQFTMRYASVDAA
jgi:hypothetical protein